MSFPNESLESSMSGSFMASSSSSLTNDTYQRAAKLFLNKNFVDSLNTLEGILRNSKELRETDELSEKVWIKSWKLYFVLLDSAAKEEEENELASPSSSASSSSSSLSSSSSSSHWPKKLRLSLIKKITDGSLYKQVEDEFGGSILSSPPDIVFGLISLITRHFKTTDILNTLSDSTELYISSMSDLFPSFNENYQKEYMKILDIYILKLLPLRDEYDYAKELIDTNEFYSLQEKEDKNKQLIKVKEHLIKKNKQKLDDERRRKELLKIREEERKLKYEQRQRELERQTEEKQLQSQPQSTSSSQPQSPSPSQSPSHSQSSPKRSASPSSQPQSIHNLNSIVSYWKQKTTSIFQLTSFWKLFAFFIIILLSVSNPISRERIRRIITNIWRKLSETARMGFKVSFV